MGEEAPRVVVLTPMSSELRPFVKAARLSPAAPVAGHQACSGSIGGVEVLALRAGMGTGPAATATKVALAQGPVAHVVVVGVAGGMDAAQLGERVTPATVVHGGTGVSYTPHVLGPLGRDPVGSMLTGDDFISEPDRLAELARDGVVALDMETAAVAAVCEAHQVPWSVARAISDIAGDAVVAAAVEAGTARADGTPDMAAVARFVARKPSRGRHLARLGRQLQVATRLAARDAIGGIESLAP